MARAQARAVLTSPGAGELSWSRGLDVVIGYQVSWILMFADYSRYTASARRGALAVFAGLAVTSLWFMPLGFAAARAAGSSEPGAMLEAVRLGGFGALLLALATLTTNFVNIYLSALAWKSLVPAAGARWTVWSIGVVGAVLSLSKIWLDRYGDFMLLLGGLLVPVGGILLARFFLVRREIAVADLYDRRGPFRENRRLLAGRPHGLGGRSGRLLLRPGRSAARCLPSRQPSRCTGRQRPCPPAVPSRDPAALIAGREGMIKYHTEADSGHSQGRYYAG